MLAINFSFVALIATWDTWEITAMYNGESGRKIPETKICQEYGAWSTSLDF